MTDEQIQNFLNDLSDKALAKGCANPTFQLQLTSHCRPNLYYCFTLSEAGGTKSEWLYGETVLDVLQQAQLAVATLATKEDRERNEYLKRVASAIEYGKKIGIDDEFINPLELQMKKLSSNIIEHKKSSPNFANATHSRADEFGDDIPF